jgi:hypothetical protein
MKRNLLLGIFLFPLIAYGQVGINNTAPTSTLDITAKNAAGSTTNVDGLLIPRVDRQRAQSMAGIPTSTLIYVNSIATGTTGGNAVNIDAVGYYYYNGTVWTKLNSSAGNLNIYNSDGTLQNNRIVTQDDYTLAFTANAPNAFSVDGSTFSVDASSDRVGIGTMTPSEKLDVNGAVIYRGSTSTDKTAAGSIDYGSDGTRILSWGPNATTNGTLGFWTGFGGAGTGERMRIHSNGNVGIATANPVATLDVVGSPTVASSLDGVIPPRVTGNQLRAKTYTASQTGAMVYVTAADSSPTGQTINVTSTGYYYFDGSLWVKLTTSSSFAGSLITKQRLVSLNPANVINSGSGLYSFRYNSSAANGYFQIRYNGAGSRTVSQFITESWATATATSPGFSTTTNTTVLFSGFWTDMGTNVGTNNELNIFRIYDLTDGKEYRVEGNLIESNGLKMAMIVEEF